MAVEEHYKQTMKGAVVEVEIPKKGGSRLVVRGIVKKERNDASMVVQRRSSLPYTEWTHTSVL